MLAAEKTDECKWEKERERGRERERERELGNNKKGEKLLKNNFPYSTLTSETKKNCTLGTEIILKAIVKEQW